MAVARVFGLVDGIEVILQKVDEDRWSVPVPFDADGEYVVEVVAEDEADVSFKDALYRRCRKYLYSRAAASKVYV